MNHAVLRPLRSWNRLSLSMRISVALVLGAIAGLSLRSQVLFLKPIGDLFVNALQMIAIPVVFTVIVCAVLNIKNFQAVRQLTLKAFIFYMCCMLLASVIALFIAMGMAPGKEAHLLLESATQSHYDVISPTLSTIISHLLPENFLSAFIQGNVLQVVIISLLLGIAIKMVGSIAEPVENLFQVFSKIVFKIVHIVMQFAPYGVFALIAWTFGSFGFYALIPLLKFVLTVYLACAVQWVVIYAVGLKLIGRMSPFHFFKAIASAMVFSFTTCSSAATLPLSIDCAEKNLGISPKLARFLLPLGVSFNLNGVVIYITVATLFAANLYGIPLHAAQYPLIMLTAVIMAMGVAAVPGSALIAMSAVMGAVHIPLGAMPLITGVDRINDMAQTTTSVVGNIFVLALIEGRKRAIQPTDPLPVEGLGEG